MELLNGLKWRYATKKFDATKKVSDADLESLKEVISLSATSYGLELYKVLIVEDPAIRAKLLPASWNQSQITDASHLLVFCSYNNLPATYIDEYLARKSEVQSIPMEKIVGYGEFMKTTISKFPESAFQQWTAKQTYIALANLMAACGELKIDACPMEGFDSTQYDEILGLKEKGLTSSVVAAIGYRHEEDATQHLAKVRKPLNDLFEVV